MAYSDIAAAAQDIQLRLRVAACISTQTGYQIPSGIHNHPIAIADYYQWQLAGQPGWGDAYAYAVANENPNHGNDPAVITDGMILSGVQAVLGIE